VDHRIAATDPVRRWGALSDHFFVPIAVVVELPGNARGADLLPLTTALARVTVVELFGVAGSANCVLMLIVIVGVVLPTGVTNFPVHARIVTDKLVRLAALAHGVGVCTARRYLDFMLCEAVGAAGARSVAVFIEACIVRCRSTIAVSLLGALDVLLPGARRRLPVAISAAGAAVNADFVEKVQELVVGALWHSGRRRWRRRACTLEQIDIRAVHRPRQLAVPKIRPARVERPRMNRFRAQQLSSNRTLHDYEPRLERDRPVELEERRRLLAIVATHCDAGDATGDCAFHRHRGTDRGLDSDFAPERGTQVQSRRRERHRACQKAGTLSCDLDTKLFLRYAAGEPDFDTASKRGLKLVGRASALRHCQIGCN